MSKPTINWKDDITEVEQAIYRRILQLFGTDDNGKLINCTVDDKTGHVEITYKLGNKAARSVSTYLKKQANNIPDDFRNKEAWKKMIMSEWRRYKNVSNRLTKKQKSK